MSLGICDNSRIRVANLFVYRRVRVSKVGVPEIEVKVACEGCCAQACREKLNQYTCCQ